MNRIIFIVLFCFSAITLAQSSAVQVLEAKRYAILNIIRAYEDSLVDLDYAIGELKVGHSLDFSEIEFLSNPESKKALTNKKENVVDISPNEIRAKANKTKYLISKEKKTKRATRIKPKIQRKVKRRVGAICRDGSRSYATGRGACSHHGGVDHWLVN